MSFAKDVVLEKDVGDALGAYVTTFISEHDQVRADLFERADQMIAHVSFPTGLDAASVTDRYLSELNRFAADRGFVGRLRLIFS
jgi:hypothetical protein